ncbi:MAG: efflux RND transporter permease subunit [Pseudomonadota bacterium]
MAQERADLPSLSVRRPYLATVLNLLIIIAGIGAVFGVEVRELPDVDRPIVSVRANYPGGSPETIDAEITSKIEGAVARVAGVVEVRSASEEGNFRIRAEFQPSTDLIAAANDVREVVSRVQRRLPDGVENLTVIKADADSRAVVQLAISSATLSIDALSRRIQSEIVPALTSVSGVADVRVSGDGQRVLRVVVDPLKLASHGLSVADVVRVLGTARYDQPAGRFKSSAQTVLVRADASIEDPRAIEAIMIRNPVRLGDVASAHFGPADAQSIARLNGVRVITLGIVRRARSNTVDIASGVQNVVAGLQRRMPELKITTTADDAIFIRSAVRDVLMSLGMAIIIVISVIALFLRRLRAALIPAVTIPVALIGTIAAIWLLGFSINLVTLLALVLATGLVVDDAIVVLENVERLKAEGTPPRAAAVIGTRQVFFAVVATTATLVSVFLPISFLPSTAGRLFAEFGIVLSVAVCISSFVALTVVAMLASRSADHGAHIDRPQRHSETETGGRVMRIYAAMIGGVLAFPFVVVGICAVLISGAAIAWTHLGEELVPREDRGQITIGLRAPPGVGLDFTDMQVEKVEAIVRPYVERGVAMSVLSITGRYDPNYAEVRAPLVDWSKRQLSEADISKVVNRALGEIPGASAYMWSSNSLNLRGSRGGTGIRFAVTGGDYQKIANAAADLVQLLKTDVPEFLHPNVDHRASQPQVSMHIDRSRAAALGVEIDDLGTTIRALTDKVEVGELTIDDRRVPILIQSARGGVRQPDDLKNVSVAATDGRMVPLSQFVSFTEVAVPDELGRLGQRRAVPVSGRLAEGASLRVVARKIEALAARTLPDGMGVLLLGEAATLDETSYGVAVTFSVALIVIFLVLVAQFESLASALVVLLTVPLGICAAIFALLVTGTSLNIYSQIGVLMLVGIMAKNAILMVEFADQLRDRGASVMDAARQASIIRLRPIAMTMLSTVLAGLPLILGTGAGSEARSAIGWVVFGGLGLAAVFTLFLTPVLYTLIAWVSAKRSAEAQQTERELAEANSSHR